MDKKLKNTRAVDRRIEKTRKAIHKAYLEYITEKNSSRITVSELARRADIDEKHFTCTILRPTMCSLNTSKKNSAGSFLRWKKTDILTTPLT